MKHKHHPDFKEITASVLLFCGIIMAFVALFLPPPGEIHESVLYLFAQILIYAGSIFGIEAYVRKVVKDEPPYRNTHSPEKTRERDSDEVTDRDCATD